MNSESRYRRYERVFHLLLSWLSLSIIAWAVVRGSVSQNAILDTYTAILSVFVFAFSIIIFGFRFGETAAQHRECYLRLQKLYADGQVDTNWREEYYKILDAFPNQSTADYERVIIEKTVFDGQQLYRGPNDTIKSNKLMLLRYIWRGTIFWFFAITVFAFGAGIYYLIYKNTVQC